MRILLCHNYYQQPGGEDQVFAAEGELLASQGHTVLRYTKHNDALRDMGRWRAAAGTIWNRAAYRELRTLIRRERPDILHATNLFPLISPSAYAAARDEGVPVVQSLHNYRLLCPKAQLMRNGRVCESCLGRRLAWPGVVHACYRDNRAATAVVAAMLAVHRAAGTWRRLVDCYIALSEFARRKFVEAGLPAERIVVKPNCVAGRPEPGRGGGDYAVYAGRLSPEKGVPTLLAAWRRLDGDIRLKVVGDGPMAELVAQAVRRDRAIQWLGRRPHAEVLELLGRARFLVFPSACYETFGLAIAEAFAKGTPVIASRQGAMSELVTDGRTGLLFEPGNAADLAAKARMLWGDGSAREAMRVAAREEFEQKYTMQENYRMLLSIYQRLIQRQAVPNNSRRAACATQTDMRRAAMAERPGTH